MKLDKELKDILLGMEWCHAVRTNHLEEAIAKIKALVVESLVDGRQISSYHDLYSGKSKEWTDGYRQGFDMCKELVLALWK